MTPIKLRSTGAFLYVRNFLHSCIYLFFFPIFQDRVTAILNVILANCHKSQIFACEGLGNFPKNSSAKFTRGCADSPKPAKFERLYVNKSPQKICCSSFNALSINICYLPAGRSV